MTPKREGGRKLELINESTAAIAEVMLWKEVAPMELSQRSLQDAPIFRLLLKVAVKGTHQCDYSNFWGSFGLPTKHQQQQTVEGAREIVEHSSCATPLLLPRELRGVRSRRQIRLIQATSAAESGCSSRVGAAGSSQSFSILLLLRFDCSLLVVRFLCISRLARRSVGRTRRSGG